MAEEELSIQSNSSIQNPGEIIILPLDTVVSILDKSARKRTKIIHEIFLIDRGAIATLYERLNARIYQQNTTTKNEPVFEVFIHFSDDVIDSVNSIGDLMNYPEGGAEITRLEMKWTYFVRFADKPALEKQVVSVDIDAASKDISGFYKAFTNFFNSKSERNDQKSSISIQITYTNYRWAVEIEKLIVDNINPSIQGFNSWKMAVHDSALGLFFVTAFLLLLMNQIGKDRYVFALEKRFADELVSLGQIPIENKISLLLEAVISMLADRGFYGFESMPRALINNPWIQGLMALLIFLLSLLVLWTAIMLPKPNDRSFIVINNGSRKCRDEYFRKHKNSFAVFVFSMFLSIAASIIAAFIFEFIRAFDALIG